MSAPNKRVLSLTVVAVMLLAMVCMVHGQERIKMCGRDLIRLAVSSCGSSRLRRSVLDSQQQQQQQPGGDLADHVLPNEDHQGRSETTTTTPSELHQNNQEQKQDQNQKQAQSQDKNQEEDQSQDQDRDQELSMVPNWYPVSSRVRRTARMISDVCCEKGCSMRELIQFC